MMDKTYIDVQIFQALAPEVARELTAEFLALCFARGLVAAGSPRLVATAGQIQDANNEYQGNDDSWFDDATGPEVRYPDPEDAAFEDYFWIQGWLKVTEGEQPISLGRIVLACKERGYADNPEFHRRALAHIEQEWSPGHYMGFEDLCEAVEDYADNAGDVDERDIPGEDPEF